VEANTVSTVRWREDDLEERSIDPLMFASGRANTSIIEKESFSHSGRADLICIRPDGTILIAEAKLAPEAKTKYVRTWCHLSGRHWAGRGKLNAINWHEDPFLLYTTIVLSRSTIDETFGEPEANSTLSSSEDYEKEDAAAVHPTTKSVYNQLTTVPGVYTQAIEAVLTQFASFVPMNEAIKLPALRLAALEDSSYLLEWTFKDRRLGFSFEPDPKDSGWYFVYSRASSELYESGTMDQLEIERLISKALTL
jgi:hypothetical protein